MWLFPSCRALAAQIRLKICHQQSSCYALARDIANHQAEPSLAELKKVEVVAADGASGVAKPNIGEGLKGRMPLWEEARLYLFSDCQVVRDLAPGLQPCCICTALSLDSSRRLVDLNKREKIPVHIFEKGVPRLPPPPRRLRRWECKTDYVLRPFFEDRSHVFRQKA